MQHVNLLKTSCKPLSVLFIGTLILFVFSSCGTIAGAITKGKRPSFIVNAPKDVVLKLDGKKLDLTSELFASSSGSRVTKDFYTAAVKLPYKKSVTLEISSASSGKQATVELKPKGSSPIFWGNLIFAPIVGHIIDGVTKNNKTLKPKYIDVTSVLNNVPMKDWPSQGKLKRIEKRKAKQN